MSGLPRALRARLSTALKVLRHAQHDNEIPRTNAAVMSFGAPIVMVSLSNHPERVEGRARSARTLP